MFTSSPIRTACGLVPPKYANAASSDLTYTVTKGKQTRDIELP